MKTITNKIIAKIFFQYLGCQFLYSGTKDNSTTELDLYALKLMIEDNDFNECTLLLTPLQLISDEDAINVAKIVFKNKKDHNIEKGKYFASGGFYLVSNFLGGYQYLQSKGYALPYLDYSVSDLVENGTIKLKTK